MWRFLIHLPEQTVEMKTGEKGLLRYQPKVNRFLVVIIYVNFGSYNALVYVSGQLQSFFLFTNHNTFFIQILIFSLPIYCP